MSNLGDPFDGNAAVDTVVEVTERASTDPPGVIA
jgi:hypothetical protein